MDHNQFIDFQNPLKNKQKIPLKSLKEAFDICSDLVTLDFAYIFINSHL